MYSTEIDYFDAFPTNAIPKNLLNVYLKIVEIAIHII